MKQLFGLECKKIGKSIVFWIFIIVLCITYYLNYGTIAEDEISNASNQESVFYKAPDGKYASETKDILYNKDAQNKMMVSATTRLISCYRQNSYEYYPFGYVKEKVMSDKEQKKILAYLMELTGLDEQTLKGTKTDSQGDDIEISGGGAYVLEPNKGKINEKGQFIAQPEDWEYREDGTISDSTEPSENRGKDFEIHVSYDRFKKIMADINTMIGKNSYFSWTMLNLYYGENDMEAAPITKNQHEDFFEKDYITGAFARYYCDSISLVVLWIPAFLIISLMLKDRRCKIQKLTYQQTISSRKLICIRYLASVVMTMIPIFILPLKSMISLIQYGNSINAQTDLFAFAKYICFWILPTVLFITAIGLLFTVLTENFLAILITAGVWLMGKPSLDKIGGGNYGIFDIIIRHNTLKGYSRMNENIQILLYNRVLISIISIILVIISIYIYEIKRKGGLSFGKKEFFKNSKHKHSTEY